MIETTVSAPAVFSCPDVWELDSSHEDRRSAPRMPKRFDTTLVCPRDGDSVNCSLRDLSEGGLYVYAPPGSSVSVGQRFEVTLSPEQQARLGGGVGESIFATVVRTEVLNCDSRSVVGAGMRFDQPLFI